jgi:hypothetical protein
VTVRLASTEQENFPFSLSRKAAAIAVNANPQRKWTITHTYATIPNLFGAK